MESGGPITPGAATAGGPPGTGSIDRFLPTGHAVGINQSGAGRMQMAAAGMVQVTQTRRTIFPGSTGLMFSPGGQQAGDVLHMHTFLRCSTEQLLSDRSTAMEEVQQLRAAVETRDDELRKLNHEMNHEKAYSAHLQNKVDVLHSVMYDSEQRARQFKEMLHRLDVLEKQLQADMACGEEKLEKFQRVQQRAIVNDEARKAKFAFKNIETLLRKGVETILTVMSDSKLHIDNSINQRIAKIDSAERRLGSASEVVKRLAESRRTTLSENGSLSKSLEALTLDHEKAKLDLSTAISQRDIAWHDTELLQKDLCERRTRLSEVEKARAEFESKYSSSEIELATAKQRLEKANNQCQDYKKEIENMGNELKSAKQVEREMLKKVLDLEDTRSTLQVSEKEKESRLATQEMDLIERSEEIRRLCHEITDMKSTAQSNREAFEETERHLKDDIVRRNDIHEEEIRKISSKHEAELETLQSDQQAALASAKKIHHDEVELLKCDKASLEHKVEFYQERIQCEQDESQRKEKVSMERLLDVEKNSSRLENLVAEKQEAIDNYAKEMAKLTEHSKLDKRMAIENAIKDTESKGNTQMTEQILELEKRHAHFQTAAEEEIASLKRQHEIECNELRVALTKKDAGGKASDLKDFSIRTREIEEKFKALAKRTIYEKEKKHQQLLKDAEKAHQSKIKALQDMNKALEEQAMQLKSQHRARGADVDGFQQNPSEKRPPPPGPAALRNSKQVTFKKVADPSSAEGVENEVAAVEAFRSSKRARAGRRPLSNLGPSKSIAKPTKGNAPPSKRSNGGKANRPRQEVVLDEQPQRGSDQFVFFA